MANFGRTPFMATLYGKPFCTFVKELAIKAELKLSTDDEASVVYLVENGKLHVFLQNRKDNDKWDAVSQSPYPVFQPPHCASRKNLTQTASGAKDSEQTAREAMFSEAKDEMCLTDEDMEYLAAHARFGQPHRILHPSY